MRVSVNEVSPGLRRWVASLHNRWGVVVASAFSDNSEDDAEDRLLYGLTDALTRLPAMTEARDKALNALKAVADCRSADEAHDIIVNQFPDLIEELEEI